MSTTYIQQEPQKALAKIEQMADSLLSQGKARNKHDAVAKALEMNPELYTEYLRENPRQTGGRF